MPVKRPVVTRAATSTGSLTRRALHGSSSIPWATFRYSMKKRLSAPAPGPPVAHRRRHTVLRSMPRQRRRHAASRSVSPSRPPIPVADQRRRGANCPPRYCGARNRSPILMTTHVLIVCTHNSARSVLGEGMLNHWAARLGRGHQRVSQQALGRIHPGRRPRNERANRSVATPHLQRAAGRTAARDSSRQ